MTAPVISDEAVAAVCPILRRYWADAQDAEEDCGVIYTVDYAIAALTAAYPYLLAQITEGAAVAIGESAWEQGSSRGPLAGDDEETWMRGANAGIDFAQTVTRAYGKATS